MSTPATSTRSPQLQRLLDDLVAERYRCLRRAPAPPDVPVPDECVTRDPAWDEPAPDEPVPDEPGAARAELLAALATEQGGQP